MERTKFIKLSLGNHQIVQGYDANNREIIEEIATEKFSTKVVAIERIKSISEKYILTDYADGKWIYWEYKDDFETIKNKLLKE